MSIITFCLLQMGLNFFWVFAILFIIFFLIVGACCFIAAPIYGCMNVFEQIKNKFAGFYKTKRMEKIFEKYEAETQKELRLAK